MSTYKPRLSPWRLLEMNLGFLGLQFSFGLQQANMGPIYSYLGAHEDQLPILQLAGPLTGLIVQPLIGALSDRTLSPWGRRAPYFVVGAVLCTAALFLMPFSSSLLTAASLLWVLDAGNNATMEPYRAYVSDRLAPAQQGAGFLTQSAFTGLAQMLAFLTPSILVHGFGLSVNAVDARGIPIATHVVFTVGAILSISTILWSILRVRELPLSPSEVAAIKGGGHHWSEPLVDIWRAIIEMPVTLRKMAVMCLFQWYAMACYWLYVIYTISRTIFHTADAHTEGFRKAVLANGEMAAFYNTIAFFGALALIPALKRFGAGRVHAACLTLAGFGMLAIPMVHQEIWLFLPAVGIGLGWASIMGTPYVILAASIPPERTGVYMGLFNMMIVIPMLAIAATLPFYYGPLMGSDPRNVLRLCGVLMMCAAVAAIWTTAPSRRTR